MRRDTAGSRVDAADSGSAAAAPPAARVPSPHAAPPPGAAPSSASLGGAALGEAALGVAAWSDATPRVPGARDAIRSGAAPGGTADPSIRAVSGRDRSTAAGTVLWPLAVLALAHVALRAALGPARDLDILWRAGGRLLAGGPLYDPERTFIYPPVAGWVLAPVAAVPFRAAVVLMTVVSVAALVCAVVLLLDLLGIPARSPVTAGVLLVLAASRPVDGLLGQGNLDVLLLLVEVLVIRCLVARRDVLAGVVLGAACAVKPTLAPLLLGTVLLGRVRTTWVAAAAGTGLTLAGLVTVRDAGVFVTGVLPMLADSNRDVLQQYDKSLHGAVQLLGLPDGVGLPARAAALTLAVVVAWRRRRTPLAAAEVMPVLLLGGLLASSFSWANYSLYLLPLLLTVVRPGSPVRTWPAWAGVFLVWTADGWPALELGETADTIVALRPTWGWVLLLAACAWSALRRTPDDAALR
jgi:arabinofuranan 3-O-arabinosyltransferase